MSFEEARQMYRSTSGVPFFEQLAQLFPTQPVLCQKVSQEFEQQKIERLGQDPLYDDVEEALAELRNQGYLLIVSSNNFLKNIQLSLGDTLRSFDMVLGCDNNIKKGASHFTLIKKRFDLVSSEILFIGDSLYDAKMAESCGVNFMARYGTFSEYDFKKQNTKTSGFQTLLEWLPGQPQVASL